MTGELKRWADSLIAVAASISPISTVDERRAIWSPCVSRMAEQLITDTVNTMLVFGKNGVVRYAEEFFSAKPTLGAHALAPRIIASFGGPPGPLTPETSPRSSSSPPVAAVSSTSGAAAAVAGPGRSNHVRLPSPARREQSPHRTRPSPPPTVSRPPLVVVPRRRSRSPLVTRPSPPLPVPPRQTARSPPRTYFPVRGRSPVPERPTAHTRPPFRRRTPPPPATCRPTTWRRAPTPPPRRSPDAATGVICHGSPPRRRRSLSPQRRTSASPPRRGRSPSPRHDATRNSSVRSSRSPRRRSGTTRSRSRGRSLSQVRVPPAPLAHAVFGDSASSIGDEINSMAAGADERNRAAEAKEAAIRFAVATSRVDHPLASDVVPPSAGNPRFREERPQTVDGDNDSSVDDSVDEGVVTTTLPVRDVDGSTVTFDTRAAIATAASLAPPPNMFGDGDDD